MIEHNPNPNVPKSWRWQCRHHFDGREVVGYAETKRLARLAMFAALGARKFSAEERTHFLRALGIQNPMGDDDGEAKGN